MHHSAGPCIPHPINVLDLAHLVTAGSSAFFRFMPVYIGKVENSTKDLMVFFLVNAHSLLLLPDP